jgi:anti-anti-sigma factor
LGESQGGKPMFSVYNTTNAHVVTVDSDLDILNAPELESIIKLSCQMPTDRVVVSLSDCKYCDSSALGVFVRYRNALGNRFAIIIPPENHFIQRIFEIAGLRGFLRIYSNVAEALDFVGTA